MRLLHAALEVVADPSSSPGPTAVAIVALAEAIDQRLHLPHGCARALWRALKKRPEATWGTLAAGAIGRTAHPEMVPEVITAVIDSGSGTALRLAACDVLAETNAAQYVSSDSIVEIACALEGTRFAGAVANVIMAVANTKEVPTATLDAIIARWLASAHVTTRLSALEVAVVKGRASLEVARRFLGDPSLKVRAAAALQIGDLLEPEAAAEIVAHALKTETVPAVRAFLLAELAAVNATPNENLF